MGAQKRPSHWPINTQKDKNEYHENRESNEKKP